MLVTNDDAAAIYARACSAWYGQRALRVVTGRMRELAQRGDAGGVAAWAKVAAVLARAPLGRHQRYARQGRLY
jgi:hypothetical protein